MSKASRVSGGSGKERSGKRVKVRQRGRKLRLQSVLQPQFEIQISPDIEPGWHVVTVVSVRRHGRRLRINARPVGKRGTK